MFIDGRTGERLHTESLHKAIVYGPGVNTPALAAYFEIMDRLMPQFLNTIVSRNIPAARILLR